VPTIGPTPAGISKTSIRRLYARFNDQNPLFVIKIRDLMAYTGERIAKEMARFEESALNGGSVLGRLVSLAGCAGPDVSEARLRTLRQWLVLGLDQQIADFQAYRRDSSGRAEEMLAGADIREPVPCCAMEAERLWFESELEVVVAVVRAQDRLQERPDPRIQRILDATFDGSGAALNAKDICAELGRSADHLTRRFRAYTEMSLGRYLRLLRLRAAIEMLRCPAVEVKAIAASVGYSGTAAFVRSFRREFGMSPSEFRAWALVVWAGMARGI
jgi:AraC-like DNA-binding protein